MRRYVASVGNVASPFPLTSTNANGSRDLLLRSDVSAQKFD